MKYRELKLIVHWWWPGIGETECGIEAQSHEDHLPMGYTKTRAERVTCPRCLSRLHKRPISFVDYDKLPPMDEENKLADQAAGNWEKFESFCWHGEPDDGGACMHSGLAHRDSEALDRCNQNVIEKEFEHSPNAWVERHNHWAVGWADVLVVRVYNSIGLITNAFRRWCAIQEQLEEYPILDEEALSEIEHNEAWEWWEREAGGKTIDEYDEDAFDQAFRDAFENRSMSENDYPGDQEMIEALATNDILDEECYEEETCDCGHRTLPRENRLKKDYPWLVVRWCPSCAKQFYMEPLEA